MSPLLFLHTSHNDAHMLSALHAGVCAYLTFHTEYPTLLHAIRAAARGETLLQPAHIACLLTQVPILIGGNDEDAAKKEEPVLTERET